MADKVAAFLRKAASYTTGAAFVNLANLQQNTVGIATRISPCRRGEQLALYLDSRAMVAGSEAYATTLSISIYDNISF
jgi:hypothetical protein